MTSIDKKRIRHINFGGLFFSEQTLIVVSPIEGTDFYVFLRHKTPKSSCILHNNAYYTLCSTRYKLVLLRRRSS